jgi:hypothetical protein
VRGANPSSQKIEKKNKKKEKNFYIKNGRAMDYGLPAGRQKEQSSILGRGKTSYIFHNVQISCGALPASKPV